MAGSSSLQKFHTKDGVTISFVAHETFEDPHTEERFSIDQPSADEELSYEQSYMPDEVTRECARRMHYAAYRVSQENEPSRAQIWKERYFKLRDMIILGNQKLVYRAVQKFTALSTISDDAIGDAFLVLMRAVASYNPWMGIRFSTYAFTCLMRGLHRLARKHLNDWLVLSLTLDMNADQTSNELQSENHSNDSSSSILHYLHNSHPLLSDREKYVVSRRFNLSDNTGASTLQEIGRELGLSKERVRQVQVTALSKLREELAMSPSAN